MEMDSLRTQLKIKDYVKNDLDFSYINEFK